MCDYSLANVPSRLAKEKESLQLHRFPTGSLGLASPTELRTSISSGNCQTSWWQRFKQWMVEEPVGTVTAVCIPPGAKLTLHGISASLQREYGVSAVEQVTFTQLSATPHSYRDAVRFSNGREVLLQRLTAGQRMEVLSLDLAEEPQPFYEELPYQASPRTARSLHAVGGR